MQNMKHNGVQKVTSRHQRNKARLKYKNDFLGDWCSDDTSMDHECYPYYLPEVQHLLQEDQTNHVQFMNGCNHGYKFCLTFPSQMMFNLAGMALPKLKIGNNEHSNNFL
jgi:hypothetical protein